MSSRILQYMSYIEYLQTPHWKETRAAAIARAGGRCALCPREADGSERFSLEVHHRDYSRLGEELPEDLVVLCSDCHQAYEVGRQACQQPA
jgi:5-methylcytosine-specific restriction endonuclease McrA